MSIFINFEEPVETVETPQDTLTIRASSTGPLR